MPSQLIDYFISNKMAVIKLDGNLEILITLKNLRKACPCAHCNGEKDDSINQFFERVKMSINMIETQNVTYQLYLFCIFII